MRVLVCGGRAYADAAKVAETLANIHRVNPIELLITGGATGADALAEKWAIEHGVLCERFPAQWSLGLMAGPIRNAEMLAKGQPRLVVAFPRT